jgi:hypothetical protein
VVGVLGVVATAGLVVSSAARSGGASGGGASPVAAAAAPASASSAPSDDVTLSVDIGAARRAAVAAVSRTGEVVAAGMFSRGDLIATFATPAFAAALAAETTAQVNAFFVALGVSGVDASKVAVVEAPITARAVPTAGGVRVQVWTVLVAAVPDTGVAREAWRTVTVDMVDLGGRWLVDGWSSAPGPAPVPAADGVFGDADAVRERLAWPAGGGE